MTAPKVSVILGVYNGERYLKEAIESVLSQTFTALELVIINDGSVDGTRSIVSSFNDRRIKAVHLPDNVGRCLARNKGLDIANGEYIAILDADDIFLPERVEKGVDYLDHNQKVGLIGSAWENIDGSGHKTVIYKLKTKYHPLYSICHSTSMYRKTCLSTSGAYRKEFDYGAEDYDLWMRIAMDWDVAIIDEVLVRYREHGGSFSYSNIDIMDNRSLFAMELAEERFLTGKDSLGYYREDQKGIKNNRKELAKHFLFWADYFLAKSKYSVFQDCLKKSIKYDSFIPRAYYLFLKSVIGRSVGGR